METCARKQLRLALSIWRKPADKRTEPRTERRNICPMREQHAEYQNIVRITRC
mgnify:CR=1 FL=1